MHRHRQFAYTARKRRKADHLGKALNAKEVPKLITLQVFLSSLSLSMAAKIIIITLPESSPLRVAVVVVVVVVC